MGKEFVTYDLALRLKSLGFNEPCLNFYHVVGGFYASCVYVESQEDIKELCDNGKQVLAPTWQSAFRWFRENNYCRPSYVPLTIAKFVSMDDMSYEEAELACLKKLIEIVEQKTK